MKASSGWLDQVVERVADDLERRLVEQPTSAFHVHGRATTRRTIIALLRAMREDLEAGGVAHLRRAVAEICDGDASVSIPFHDLRVLTALLRDALHDEADRTPGLDRPAERTIDGWLQQMAFQIGLHFIVRREDVIEQQSSELEVQLAELQAANGEANRLLDLVRKVSLPILPVHRGVLVVPVIGTLDAERGQQLIHAVLEEVTRTRSHFVIFDITGVAVFDAAAADSLGRTIGATRLLGAELILVGVSPDVAQTIVGAGLRLGDVVICRGLQEGLNHALERLAAVDRRPSA